MADQRDMTDLEQAVWEWLVAHHAGQENAAPRAAIIERYNLYHVTGKLNDRLFRRLCADLIEHWQRPICPTSAEGYYVARTPNELEHGIAELTARIDALAARARSLKAAIPLEPQGRLW